MDRFNVIVLLLGPGEIQDSFEESCNVVCGPFSHQARNDMIMSKIINQICHSYSLDYALVNSLESRSVLIPLAENNVPNVLMIHEFYYDGIYTSQDFLSAIMWAGSVVFPAKIVQDSARDALCVHTKNLINSTIVLNQGKSKIPCKASLLSDNNATFESLNKLLFKNSKPKPFVVLGAGSIIHRKGVDLFIEAAAEIKKLSPDTNIVFVWIGSTGTSELKYFESLKKMIDKKGLKNSCFLFDSINNFEEVYGIADLFYMSSRLDPFPNVVIDAMNYGIPVICFAGTTGVVEILDKDEHTRNCIVSHLNVKEAAQKILAVSSSKDFQNELSKSLKKLSKTFFNISEYVDKLLNIVKKNAAELELEKADINALASTNDFNRNFYLSPLEKQYNPSRIWCIRSYIRGSKKI